MKLNIGHSAVGTPIPRIFNPLVFAGVATVMAVAAAIVLSVAALLLAYAPLSFLSKVKVSD